MINIGDSMRCPTCDRDAGSNVIECERCAKLSNYTRLLTLPTNLGNSVSTRERVEHDQKLAFGSIDKFIEVADMSIDDIFVFMKKLEALAAGANLIHAQRLIKNRVSNEVQETAIERQSTFTKAMKDHKDSQRPKKERKLLDARDKAILALTNIGVDRATAEAQVDARMLQVGRAANPTTEIR